MGSITINGKKVKKWVIGGKTVKSLTMDGKVLSFIESIPPNTRVWRVTTQSWNIYHTHYYFKKLTPDFDPSNDWYSSDVHAIYIGFNPADFNVPSSNAQIGFSDNGHDGRGEWNLSQSLRGANVGEISRYIPAALKSKPYIYLKINTRYTVKKLDGVFEPHQEPWLPSAPE